MSERIEIGNAILYHCDCEEIVPLLSGIDAVITDPPYGMGWNTDSTRYSGPKSKSKPGSGRSDWGAIKNDNVPFDPSPWLAFPRVVMFGCNHYAARLPVGTTLVWLKKADHLFGTFLSDAEMAWMKGGHGVYCFRKQFPASSRMAENNGKVAHPTQKPIALMEWCMERAKVPAGGVVLDPYMGSGTTGVAALRTGRKFVGIEADRRYFDTACERISVAASQPDMFND